MLVLCEDEKQQQPFSRTENRTTSVPNPFKNVQFLSSVYCFNLTGQHRLEDSNYLQFLNHIRNWRPSQGSIQHSRVICNDGCVRQEHILRVFEVHPETTILTYTNNDANAINSLVSEVLFTNVEALATLKLD